jgi:hypothetical protein
VVVLLTGPTQRKLEVWAVERGVDGGGTRAGAAAGAVAVADGKPQAGQHVLKRCRVGGG